MNQDYFDKIYEKTYRPLLRYAIVHLNDPLDAEDALQNVFIDFYRRIEARGHADILAPQLFLLKMLKREIIRNYAESSTHETSALEEDVIADPLSFESTAKSTSFFFMPSRIAARSFASRSGGDITNFAPSGSAYCDTSSEIYCGHVSA